METNYTNIKHFKFNSVYSLSIIKIDDIEKDNQKESDLILFEIMEHKYTGLSLEFDKNYLIRSFIPFFSELNEKEKEVFKNWLSES